jgi:REP element-mobilizing transposase RayT
MPDYIRLFVKGDSFDSPTDIVKVFKGVTGLRMSRKCPDLESKLWRGVMWPPNCWSFICRDD